MKNIKQIFFLLILLSTASMFSQNLAKLIENNGFRKIKLNTNVNDYVDENGYYDFLKKDSTTIKYFERFTEYDYIYASSNYDKIGNSKIKYIFVKTLDDLIYNIFVVTEPNFELFELIQLAYGKPTNSTGFDLLKGGGMAWKTTKLTCNLTGYKGHYYFQLHYYDELLREKAWKLEKVKLYKEQNEKKQKAIKEF